MNDIKKSWMDVIHPLVNIKHPWMNSSIHPSILGLITSTQRGVEKVYVNYAKIMENNMENPSNIKKELLNFSTIVNHLLMCMFFELLQ
jgi:hypothetical protein